ncbi:MAG: thiamine ABC transporter substrate-binding protein [Anaerolineaceae bacterium]
MKKRLLFSVLTVALMLSACIKTPTPTAVPATPEPKEPQTLTVMTHDSFAVSKSLITAFESLNNVKITFVKGGDAGSALNRLILSAASGSTSADVFYGIDNTFLSRALDQRLFETYQPPSLKDVSSDFQLDSSYRVTPIDYGDVCINYDKQFFAEKNLPLPETLVQLQDPTYHEMLVVENPATSSPGLAFLLTTVATFGEAGWLDWWGAMKENGVVIVSDWETAYYTNFSGSSGRGPQPMVVSYASSPAAELVYSDPKLDEAPTGSLTGENMCWRQIEFAGILKGTQNRALAEKFIDFLLSKDFQEDMPLQMFVYPVLNDAALPEDFVKASQTPTKAATLGPKLIAENRDAWVQAWSDLMLK